MKRNFILILQRKKLKLRSVSQLLNNGEGEGRQVTPEHPAGLSSYNMYLFSSESHIVSQYLSWCMLQLGIRINADLEYRQ